MFVDNTGPPNKISINGQFTMGSKTMAPCLNKYFIDKVNNIKKEIPNTINGPLEHFRKFIKKPEN